MAENVVDMTNRVLGVLLRNGGVDVRSVDGEEAAVFSVEAEQSVTTGVKILEEAVYATPSLLGDYGKTIIIIDSPRFTLVPSRLASDDEMLESVVGHMWPGVSLDEVLVNDGYGDACLISVPDAAVTGFAGRTFQRPQIVNRLSALCQFFATQSKPVNNMRLYAHFSNRSCLDIIVMTGDGLLMANSFECGDFNDAVYFIMAAVKDCGFDQLDDELLLSGDVTACDEVTDMLRKYVNSVMPLMLPPKAKDCPLELQITEI